MAGYRRPESVLILVYVDRTQILLLRRKQPFSFWQSVTGSLDPGESPISAARRELLEETGLTSEGELSDSNTSRTFTIDPRWRHHFAPGVLENVEHEFRFCLPAAVAIRLDSNEHERCRWVDIDNAIEMAWSWTNRAAFEQLRDEL